MAEINDILIDLNNLAKRNYFIPSYQRGYRWGKQQVTELLDDILDFSINNGTQDYYCLQPVVVRQLTQEDIDLYKLSDVDTSVWYEVIDGQQRITTLALIIHYFNACVIGPFKQTVPRIIYGNKYKVIDI